MASTSNDPPAEAAGAAGRRALTTLEFVNSLATQNLYKNNMILTLSKFLIAVSMANLCVYTYILNMDLFKICCLDAPFRAALCSASTKSVRNL